MRTSRVFAGSTALAGTLALGVFVAPSMAAIEERDGLIAYAIGGGEDPWVIRAVDADGANNRRLIGPRRKLFRLGPSGPEWSPDGRKLLFGGHHGFDRPAQSLWYSTPSGKRIRRIRLGLGASLRRRSARAITLYGWDWAPNGRRVVFAARKGTAAPRLYTISINGRHRRALRRGWWPQWSGDGRQIVFSFNAESDPNPLYGTKLGVVKPSNTGFRRLTDSEDDASPSVSPDGRRIVFVRNRADAGEHWRMINVSGRGERVIGSNRRDVGYCPPQWTPNGTRLAAVRFDRGREPDSPVLRFVTLRMNGENERVKFTFPHSYFGFVDACDFSWQPR